MPENSQPTLALTQLFTLTGVYPSQGAGSGDYTPMATIRIFAGNFALTESVHAQGQTLPINQNQAMFSLLGTNFGGNGQTNFALPNLDGRLGVDRGHGDGLSNHNVGEVFGADLFGITQSQLPASSGGTSVAVSNAQPALTMTWAIRATGDAPDANSGAGNLNLVGALIQFAGNFIPAGFFEANGQLLSIAANPALFAVLGTTFGGDGITTFALPDLRGRTIVGASGEHELGDMLGSESAQITLAQMPTNMGGAGEAIDNYQPSVVLNFIIATTGQAPTTFSFEQVVVGEILPFAGDFAPAGYQFAQGQVLLIADYQALFNVVGTIYGGDGITTFALPDLRDRAVVGVGSNATIGEMSGVGSFVLTSADIPALNFSGTSAADTLYGGDANDTISGLNGDDTITGNAGNDNFLGGVGNDTLIGGAGNDTLDGGADSDTASYAGASTGVTVSLLLQGGAQTTGAGADVLSNFENLTGSSHSDTLTGNGNANTLSGGGGADALNGGAGADTLNGGAGFDIANYLIASTGATWARNFDGTWTITAGADGVDTVSGVELLHFTDRDVHLDGPAHNFFGDGASDILLRRASDGVTSIWSMNGATVAGSDVTQWQAGVEWSIEAGGDFNGDGRDDFFLRRTDGVTSIWSMNGTSVESANVTSWQAGTEWTFAGIGDFNGDGRDDFALRRASDGVTSVWQMDGANVSFADVTSQQAGTEWDIDWIGDFNGDGRDDFLIRRDDGATAIWQMNGATVAAAALTGQQAGNDWAMAGVGDFDGDGRDDILLRHDSGVMAVWTMNGASVAQSSLTSQQAGGEWSVASVGDFNADGRDDILLLRDDGVTAIWTMNGATVTSANVTSQQAGVEWGII